MLFRTYLDLLPLNVVCFVLENGNFFLEMSWKIIFPRLWEPCIMDQSKFLNETNLKLMHLIRQLVWFAFSNLITCFISLEILLENPLDICGWPQNFTTRVQIPPCVQKMFHPSFHLSLLSCLKGGCKMTIFYIFRKTHNLYTD